MFKNLHFISYTLCKKHSKLPAMTTDVPTPINLWRHHSTKSWIPKQSQKQDDIRGIINVSEENCSIRTQYYICLMKDYMKFSRFFNSKKKLNMILINNN